MTRFLVFTIICIGFLSGCTATNSYVQSDKIIQKNETKDFIKEDLALNYQTIVASEEYKNILEEQKEESTLEQEDLNQVLMDFYKEWKNVKYKYGGNSKKGIDCSAFTQRIFKEKFDLEIPRTTLTQVKIGKPIKKSELETGDLVFFKTGVRDRHVGVYMGNGKFMHASIKGVKFTKLDKPYYKRKYWTSRRVFN